MPLDPNIILQGRGVEIQNPMDAIGKAMSMRQMMQQSKAYDKKTAEETALSDSFKKNLKAGPDGKMALDKDGVTNDLMQGGYGAQALEYQDKFKKQSQEEQDREFGVKAKQLELVKKLSWSIHDEGSYQQAKAEGIRLGLPNSDKLPPQFDPNFVKQMQMKTLEASEQMAQQWKQVESRQKQQEINNNRGDKAFDRDLKTREMANKEKETNLKANNKMKPVYDKDGNIVDYVNTGEAKGPQFQAATFGRRMEQAEDAFTSLTKRGYDRTDKKNALKDKFTPDAYLPEDRMLQDQAERNFVNAILRRESGAAISKSEFDSAEKQYFPRAGNTPEVLAQKEANRKVALSGVRAESGNAWDQVPRIVVDRKQVGPAPRSEIKPSNEAHAGQNKSVYKTSEIEWAD